MTRIDAFVDQHKWQLLCAIIGGAVAITAAKAQLDAKAEKSDVRKIEEKIDAIVTRQDNVIYLLCRAPENRNDSVCK